MKINVGCGPKKLEGYLNIDNNPFYEPDILLDVLKTWPFEKESVDEILFDNVVEHLDSSVIDWLNEVYRVLKPNGVLKIICPNCFHWKTRFRYLLGEFGPNSGYHYDHRWLFKPSWLKELLVYKGFAVNNVSDLFDQEVNITARKRL